MAGRFGRAKGAPLLGAAICLLGLPSVAEADFIFTPPPGVTKYRLAFVTTTQTDATSSSILTYNGIVQTEAASNTIGLPVTTWAAIASTSGISALANIACTPDCSNDPIFLVDGTEVATSSTALFAGSILNEINEDENGNSATHYVWTGSNADGTAAAGATLGSSTPVYGYNTLFPTSFMIDLSSSDNSVTASLYGISGELTVPEPASLSLLAFGGLITGFFRRWRRPAN